LSESAKPTVLFTGNGYHVYQPIKLPILEIFCFDIAFEIYQNPSTEFIRYVAQRRTGGKNDPCNHPSVNSCMVRVPGSINSKNNKAVEVVESWNGIRPAANRMLFNFQIQLAAKKLAFDSRKSRITVTSGKRLHYKTKTYRHFGYTNNSQLYHTIDWIESILTGPGISDWRKITMALVLAPYLVNVRKCDYNTAYKIIAKWLDKCAKIRRLDFSARTRINYVLEYTKDGPYDILFL
jgi:hypothetical protein